MTDPGGGDKPGRGDKPDPFAPLPLADLPPVRGRGDEPSAPVRTPAPSVPPTAFVSSEAPPLVDHAWDPPPPPTDVQVVEPPAPSQIVEQAWTEAAPPEPPLLPASYSENELRDAVGVTPRFDPSDTQRSARIPVARRDDDDEDGAPTKRSRKTMLVAALSVVVGGGIAALVLLGKVNSAKYVLACEADQVVVEQGRSFPPWGTSVLGGAEWKSLKIPPETPCHPQETEDKAELAQWYLKILTGQATRLLAARELSKVDEAEGVLNQSLLVSRELRTDGDAKDARAEIDRLLGDVVYWRASAKLRGASETLAEAAKQFDAASTKNPAHFTDASEWASYTRKLMDQLKAGPGGIPAATFPPLPPAERPTAPPGVALPVEPDGSAAGSAEPVAAPDAGVPSGGVLL